MKKPIVWIFALTMTVCATLVLSLSCISFSLQNTALKNEVGDLNNKNSELNKQVQDLNNVIGDLQETVDFFEDQVALITYEVDGQVWKIDVAQVGEKIELPVAPDTATEIFNGWKVEGDDKVYAGTYEATAGVKFVADMFNPTEVKGSWQPMEWKGNNDFYGYDVWTDGVDQYLGFDYRLNKATNTWETITWNWEGQQQSYTRNFVWTDGVEYFYSCYDGQYVLDRETHTWKIMEWNLNGIDSQNFLGEHIFNFQGKSYYLYQKLFYVLDVATHTWENMNWELSENYYGNQVWINGNTAICYLNYQGQLKIDFVNKKFVPLNMEGLDESFYGARYIWSDGEYNYLTQNEETYWLNSATTKWTKLDWNWNIRNGNLIWTDGTNYYYSLYSDHYVFVKA